MNEPLKEGEKVRVYEAGNNFLHVGAIARIRMSDNDAFVVMSHTGEMILVDLAQLQRV